MNEFREFDEIIDSLSDQEYEDVSKFINTHIKYTLEDVYNKPDVYHDFTIWQNRQEFSRLNYYEDGIIKKDPFIRITIDDMMEELENNPKLKTLVLACAKNELKENPLFDKQFTVRAIELGDVEIFYNHDTEVRENFCNCFLAGIKERKEELREEGKQLKPKKEKEYSR